MSALNAPVVKQSLDRLAARQLREAILSGELAPGTRITEQAIASQLNLSRGTIRTALHHLSAEGLMIQNIYSSWEVMGLTAEDAAELFTLRSALEGLAGRLAAGRMTAENANKLKEAFQHLVATAKTGSKQELANADLAVHVTIVELSGNARLIQFYHRIELQLKIYVRSVNGLMPSAESVAQVHEPMVNAVLEGDAKRAEELLVEHCEVYGAKLIKLFEVQEIATEENDGSAS